MRPALGFSRSAPPFPALVQNDAAQATEVGEIVVTARRREETANSVGMAIQALGGEELQQLRVTNAKDLSSAAPSFSVSQSEQGVATYRLRGISFSTINMSAIDTIGAYVDEAAYACPMMYTDPIMGLQHVEVWTTAGRCQFGAAT